jgi:hypothetical protein
MALATNHQNLHDSKVSEKSGVHALKRVRDPLRHALDKAGKIPVSK